MTTLMDIRGRFNIHVLREMHNPKNYWTQERLCNLFTHARLIQSKRIGEYSSREWIALYELSMSQGKKLFVVSEAYEGSCEGCRHYLLELSLKEWSMLLDSRLYKTWSFIQASEYFYSKTEPGSLQDFL